MSSFILANVGPLNPKGSIPDEHDGEQIAEAIQTRLCKWEGRKGTVIDVADAIVFALGSQCVSDKRKAGFLRFFTTEQLDVLKTRISSLRDKVDPGKMERVLNTAIATAADDKTKQSLQNVKMAFLERYPQMAELESRHMSYTPTYQPLPQSKPITSPQLPALPSSHVKIEKSPIESAPAVKISSARASVPAEEIQVKSELPQSPRMQPLSSSSSAASSPTPPRPPRSVSPPAPRAQVKQELQSPQEYLKQHLESLSASRASVESEYQSPLEYLQEHAPEMASMSPPAAATRQTAKPVKLKEILGEVWERAESTPLNHLIGGRLAQCYDKCKAGAKQVDFSKNPELAKALLYYILNTNDKDTAISRYEAIYAKLDLKTNPGHRGMEQDSMNLHNVPKKLLSRDSHEAAPSSALQPFLKQLFKAANIQ